MEAYNTTDRLIHQLCQILAKVNRTYVAKVEDDSHTNLYFDSLENRIYGRWIEASSEPIILSINLNTQAFEILNHGYQVLFHIPFPNKTTDELENVLQRELNKVKLDTSHFKDPLHFEIPNYEFADKPFPDLDKKELKDWMYFRALANQACMLLMGKSQVFTEIRIWPHHFDTGIFLPLKSGCGIGFGLAMKDDYVPCPHFYMAGYPETGELVYSELPKSPYWKWKIDGYWKGAVLPIDEMLNYSLEQQEEAIQSYIDKVFSWYVEYESSLKN